MTKLSKNFNLSEFECPCGKCKAKRISLILITKLQQLRDRIGEPIFITSGCRCPIYNKKIGGHSKSPHLLGKAADIQVKKWTPIGLAFMADNNIRLGIYPNHLHMDIMPPNPSKYWLVKKYGQNPY
ncbi:unnamed protein product, partial [marine sediment metagenome]